jgi:hypothetical protein
MRIVFRYLAMQDVVDFALATLREKSPVGAIGDQHPGLYRDSHMVFLTATLSPMAMSAHAADDCGL